VGNGLNEALGALERANAEELEGVLGHIDFNRKVGKTTLSDQELRDLINHFSRYRLRDEDFEFPDLLGAAYEYLIKQFADTAGKKGGEFYTPREVVRLMVRLSKPQEGHRIYDPCVGSGGMLVQSKEYVEEHNQDGANLGLYGQDENGGVWAICKMNLLFHGIRGADIRNENTLADPQHTQGGELMRFDRVITNPPFSQKYTKKDLDYKERFKYGYTSARAKRADLMFVQHMIASARRGGKVCTVMPHGVLFRSRKEQGIREEMLKEDLLEAVIGLPANLFYNTGIPASILIFHKGDKPEERRDKVLFINADREYEEGSAQNYLRAEHIEKIVSTYRAFEDVADYAAVVPIEELEENDWNLNIRRYADNAPPPEPQDVRAHLKGGVPVAEIRGKQALFDAHGLDPMALFTPRADDPAYVDFPATFTDKAELNPAIEADAAVQAREAALHQAFEAWWAEYSPRITALANTQGTNGKHLSRLREELLESFREALAPVGMLQATAVHGIIAGFWDQTKNDFRTLQARGAKGVIDGWRTSITTALEDKQNGTDPLDHKLVAFLLSDFVDELERLRGLAAELDGKIKAAEAQPDEEDEEGAGDDDAPSVADIKAWKQARTEANKKLKAQQASFEKRLDEAVDALDEDAAAELLLRILHGDVTSLLQDYVRQQRQAVITAFETWWDKYKVTFEDIENERDKAARDLQIFLTGLGYA